MNWVNVAVSRLVSFARFLWVRTWGRALILMTAVLAVTLITLSVSFSHERSQREAELASVMPSAQRDPAEIRGILSGLIRARLAHVDRAPALIPPSMWDDPACAGAIISLTNWLIGGPPRLRSTSAWTFERDNAEALLQVIDRGHLDFQIGDERITEEHDRMWQLARYRLFRSIGQGAARTADGIYIIGYKYKRTLADPKIREALGEEGAERVGLNSHLTLLLGRMDGHWWVYHFFHDPEQPNASPFRVDAIDEPSFTSRFDMVRIWRVRGVDLGLDETPVVVVNPAQPYTAVRSYLGHANRFGDRAGFFVDTAMMGIFGDSQQFPRIERIESPRAPHRVTTTAAPTPSRPTARPQPRQHPLERRGKHGLAQVSRRNVPPPRVGAINQNRREERHAPHTSPRR